jgi:hypothetical protein
MKNNYPKHVNDKPDNNILILGISPGFAPSPPESKTGKRVKRWLEVCGVSEEEYDWRNLVDEAGAVPKMQDVRLRRYEVANYDKVICLGNRPSQWCKSLSISHLKVPHPSGTNRKWNDPDTEPQVMSEIRSYVLG